MTIRRKGTSDGFGQFREDVRCGIVGDCVNRVQPQSVEMIFGEPIKRIVDEKIPHDSTLVAIEVDPISPRSMMAVRKKLWSVRIKIITFRAEMVVYDIKQDHDSAAVGGLNKLLEIFGLAVRAVGSKLKNTVIAPVALARKIRHWHQLQGSDSQILQIVKLLAHRRESPAWCERANMDFIDDRFFPTASNPGFICPYESSGIDDFAWTVHILWLEAGNWVGN